MKLTIISIFFIISATICAQKYNEVNHFSMDTLKWEKMSDKVFRKYAYGSAMTVSYFKLLKGSRIPEHQHPYEQISHVISGEIEAVIQGKKYILKKGDILIIPANVPHTFSILEETIIMEIFSPIRMDWIQNKADYLTK